MCMRARWVLRFPEHAVNVSIDPDHFLLYRHPPVPLHSWKES